MLKFNTNERTFESLQLSELKAENILERYDFQSAMVKSWETVKNKIGLPTSYLIGQEINPHESVGNAIDLLAFDPDDSSLIVIELKRDKNKLQLLQAISYAAMIATWDKEKLIAEIQRETNPEPSELIDLINSNELNTEIKIILVSEYYDPEVIITAEWLSRSYRMHITAFAVKLHKLEQEIFIDFEQRLPLKELADIYEKRSKRTKSTHTKNDITWEDVLPKLKYSFASKALSLCMREKEGEPSRRCFRAFRSNYDGFKFSINFREKYLNIYLTGKPDNAEEVIKSKFSLPIEILPWQGGFSFNVENEQQFNDLTNWLKME
jgi:hypothetical protein